MTFMVSFKNYKELAFKINSKFRVESVKTIQLL